MTDYKEKFEELYDEPGAAPWTFEEPHQALVDLVEKEIINPCKVLEIGCGEGFHALYLASRGFEVHAFDRSETAVRYAKQHAKEKGVSCNFFVGDYHDLNDLEGEFDFIFDWRFLHEITDEGERRTYAEDIISLLRPGGKYLSVAFSGDTPHWGTGKIRTAPTDVDLYFATLDDLRGLFSPSLKEVDLRLIKVPEKPDMQIETYFSLFRKEK
jgi:SAM-dependent methyltransferase